MTPRTAALAVVAAALCGLAMVSLVAPGYLSVQGFPLDDAWTHAVYGRSLALTGHFDYTAGVPSGGPMSPLWATLVALPHLAGPEPEDITLVGKLMGFALHVLAAVLLCRALLLNGNTTPERVAGPLLVAVHPDLISASLSGVETPLAAAFACGLLSVACRRQATLYAILALVAPFARPELAVLSLVFPPILFLRDRTAMRRMGLAGSLGSLAALGAMAGGVLPSARVPSLSAEPVTAGVEHGAAWREILGFTEILGTFPVVDSSVLLAGAAVAALYLLVLPAGARPAAAVAGALGGLCFLVIAFALMPSTVAPRAFYTQRHALPALPLLVGTIPVLAVETLLRALSGRPLLAARVAVLLLLAVSTLADAPSRYRLLANDARNVDEVSVAIGRVLARGADWQVIWATDGPGAIRYFGRGSVIDLTGANASPVMEPRAQAFLDGRRPHFIEVAPRRVSVDQASMKRLRGLAFRTSTPDTSSGRPDLYRQQWLVSCSDATLAGSLQADGRSFQFRCGEGSPLAIGQ